MRLGRRTAFPNLSVYLLISNFDPYFDAISLLGSRLRHDDINRSILILDDHFHNLASHDDLDIYSRVSRTGGHSSEKLRLESANKNRS